MLQSSYESGPRTGYDAERHRNGSRLIAVVDTLGHLLDIATTPANGQEQAQVGKVLSEVHEVSSGNVQVAIADLCYTVEQTAAEADEERVTLKIVKLAEARKGFVLKPKSWEVECNWVSRLSSVV
jgi:Transposase DDE domain